MAWSPVAVHAQESPGEVPDAASDAMPAPSDGQIPPTPTPIPTSAPTPSVAPTPALSGADITHLVAGSIVHVLAGKQAGTGVRVDAGILTNEHLVSGQQNVDLVTVDGRHGSGKVVSTDPAADLALITSDLSLPALASASAREQAQGDE